MNSKNVCINCGSQLNPGDMFCRFCGTEQTKPDQIQMIGYKRCACCRNLLQQGDRVCRICGTPQPVNETGLKQGGLNGGQTNSQPYNGTNEEAYWNGYKYNQAAGQGNTQNTHAAPLPYYNNWQDSSQTPPVQQQNNTRKKSRAPIFILIGAVILTAGITATVLISNSFRSKGTYLAPFKSYNGKWGYIDLKGNIVIEPKYDSASDFDSNGLAVVGAYETDYIYSDNIHYGMINSKGEEVILCKNLGIEQIDEYGYCRIEQYDGINDDYYYGVADIAGNEWISIDYSSIYNIGDSGHFIARTSDYDRCMITNSDMDPITGKVFDSLSIICEYDTYKPVNHDGHYYIAATYNGMMGVINERGEEIVPFDYDFISTSLCKDLLLAKTSKGYGYIDLQGRERIPCKYADANNFTENGLAAVSDQYRSYYINEKGKKAFRHTFDEAYSFAGNIGIVWENGKTGVINEEGEWIIQPEYDYVYLAGKMLICTQDTSDITLYYLFDKDGRLVSDDADYYDSIESVKNIVVFRKDGYFGVQDTSGKHLVDSIYDNYWYYYGIVNLYNEGTNRGIAVKSDGSVISREGYSIYVTKEESDFITALENEAWDGKYVKSAVLNMDGDLIKEFNSDDIYNVGCFVKVSD